MELASPPFSIKMRNFFMWLLGTIVLYFKFVSGFLVIEVEKTSEGKWKFVSLANETHPVTGFISSIAIFLIVGFVVFEIISRFSRYSDFSYDVLKERQLFYYLSWAVILEMFVGLAVYIAGSLKSDDLFLELNILTSIASILLIFILFRKNLSLIGINRPNSYRRLILGFFIGAVSVYFFQLIMMTKIMPMLPIDLYSSRENLLDEMANSNFLLAFLFVVILAPLAEEFIYRGVFQSYFAGRVGVFFALILSSIAFATMHFDPSSFLAHFGIGLIFGLSGYFTIC